MPQQNLPEPDARDSQNQRRMQRENFELRLAAAEVEAPLAAWFVERRIDAERTMP